MILRIVLLLLALTSSGFSAEPLAYVPAAIDNPLKGLVPYSGDRRDNFPHSMEFGYLPLGKLMTGPAEFNWQPLEDLLNEVAGRGHQLVFRVWMVYPGKDGGIPQFLIRDGLKVTRWQSSDQQPAEKSRVQTPDYNDPRMRQALARFIAALGKKYDGDPRIGFVTAGLLGLWGEWHEFPREELFASKATQTEVLDAFATAFKTTKVLLRYPIGEDHWLYSDNSGYPFGYHDDSFAWATLDTGRSEDDWFYMRSLKASGPAAQKKWQGQPIGGEIRPELWGKIFDNNVADKKAQDFGECITETHVSWLMDTGMTESRQSAERVANASRAVRQMGYEFHVTHAAVSRTANLTNVQLKIRNTGVAPFYYDWNIVVAALDSDGRPLRQWSTDWKVSELLPKAVRAWELAIESSELPTNTARLAMKVVNPVANGRPLRFANSAKRQQADGWFRIGDL